jgi:sugar-specific transcriptional regulator TrmB
MIHQQVLQNIGLTENEARVYLALLPLKKSEVSVLGHRTGLHRNVVRHACKKLKDLGLIAEEKVRHTFFYSPESPEKIFDLLESRKREINEKRESFHKIFGDLKAIIDPTIFLPKYYEGREAVIKIYEDVIKTASQSDKRVYSWQDIGKIEEVAGKDYVDSYIQQRIKDNIVSYAIMPKNKTNLDYAKKNQKRNIKFIEGLDTQGQIKLYGDKIAFVTLHKNKPVGFVFRGEVMANYLKSIFKSSWEGLPKN